MVGSPAGGLHVHVPVHSLQAHALVFHVRVCVPVYPAGHARLAGSPAGAPHTLQPLVVHAGQDGLPLHVALQYRVAVPRRFDWIWLHGFVSVLAPEGLQQLPLQLSPLHVDTLTCVPHPDGQLRVRPVPPYFA